MRGGLRNINYPVGNKGKLKALKVLGRRERKRVGGLVCAVLAWSWYIYVET